MQEIHHWSNNNFIIIKIHILGYNIGLDTHPHEFLPDAYYRILVFLGVVRQRSCIINCPSVIPVPDYRNLILLNTSAYLSYFLKASARIGNLSEYSGIISAYMVYDRTMELF